MRSSFFFTPILLSVLVFGTTAEAGTLVVDVVDESNVGVLGAEVTLSGHAMLGGSQIHTTGGTGQVVFDDLPAGSDYVVTSTHASLVASNAGVEVLDRSTTHIVLVLGEVEVLVTHERRTDTESTSRSTVLTKDFLHRVPSGRSYHSATQMARGEGGNPHIGGAASNENTPPIRAAVTDDNLHYGAFVDFLAAWSDRQGTVGRYTWMDIRSRSMVEVVNRSGDPVPNATVQIGKWTGTTTGDGTVAVYPRLFDLDGAQTITVSAEQQVRTLPWSPGVMEVELPTAPVAATVPLDVLLILDTTGSMGDELDRLKSTLLAVTERVRDLDRPTDLRFGAVLYKDTRDAYVTKTLPFTSDVEAFQRQLMEVRASGGGDEPEALGEALHVAMNEMTWRADGARLAFVVADAPPQMRRKSYADAAKQALADGVRIHTVAASGLSDVGSLVFRQVAQLTGGHFVFIEYGSVAASAADHGVHAQDVKDANNLDVLLYDRIRDEVVGFGRADRRQATAATLDDECVTPRSGASLR